MKNIIQELNYRYQKNLDFFRKKVPFFYEIAQKKGKRNVEIIINKGNSLNLTINGTYLYEKGQDPKEIALKQTEYFLKNPSRILHAPLLFPDGPLRESLNHFYVAQIYKIAEQYGLEEDFEHDPHFLPFVLTLGLGFGYQLEYLLKKTQIKYLVILEEDIELLKPSFYTLDWKKIIKYFSQPGRDIFIFIDENPQNLYKRLYQTYEQTHPMFAFCSYIWTPRWSPVFKEVIRLIKEELFVATRGWGFFDDEFLSLLQTLRNIKLKVPVFTGKRKASDKTLAIIVGSGPSLDRRIDFLKKYASTAVIISCGTAIRTLEHEGIRPDFHVELERTKPTYDILLKSVSSEFLKKLNIVAPNPVYHEIFNLGSKAFMFLKGNDAGSSLFPKEFSRFYFSNPTVTNAGLSLAIYSGFKNIALVGTDFGTLDPAVHHSSKSAYYDSQVPVLNRDWQFPMEIKEYHGKVYTNSTLLWSKKVMEQLILSNKVQVFNLSEGLSIFGSIRRTPEQFSFSSENKEDTLKSLFSSLDYPYEHIGTIEKNLSSLLYSSKKFIKIAKDILKDSTNREKMVNKLCQLHTVLFRDVFRENFSAFMLYKGSFLQISNLFYLYLYMIYEEEKQKAFLKEALPLFLEFLDRTYRNLFLLYKIFQQKDKIFDLKLNKSYFLILE